MGADQRLKVESSTLRAKADSITSDYPTLSTSAVPPCMLLISGLAMQKLEQNFQQLVGTVAAGKAEAARLAACLNAAADAYDKADAEAKASVDSGAPSGGAPVPVNPNLPPAAPPAPLGKCTPPPADDGVDWPTAVAQFDAGDQCSSLFDFISALRQFADQLTDHGKNFSMGDTHWDGDAAEAAEGALRRHESWLYDLAEQTRELAKQGNDFIDAHLSEHSQHPTAQDVATVNELSGSDWMAAYHAMQVKSDQVRQSYARRIDFADMTFKEPPSGAYPSSPVSAGDVAKHSPLEDAHKKNDPSGGQSGSPAESGGGQPSSGGSPQAASPSTNPAAAQEQPQESGGEKPSGGEGGSPSGGEGGGSPSGGGEGAGAGSGGGLPGGLGDGTGLGSGLPDDGGLKPASTGGGAGGAGAGGGLGGQPLQPAASAPAMGTSAASTGAGPGGVGGGGAGGGAMGGGMGGGMGGMGHGNREGGKEKKRNPNLSPEESLYVEDRPYTDPVIGHTRRTKIDDRKETK